jgi:MATE family multidrug resistance protein
VPAVLDYAAKLVIIAGIFQLMDGLQAIASGLLRGLKDARVPMIMALISYWPVGFLLAWVLGFPLGLGGEGVWYGILVGLTVASITLSWRFIALVQRQKQAIAV